MTIDALYVNNLYLGRRKVELRNHTPDHRHDATMLVQPDGSPLTKIHTRPQHEENLVIELHDRNPARWKGACSCYRCPHSRPWLRRSAPCRHTPLQPHLCELDGILLLPSDKPSCSYTCTCTHAYEHVYIYIYRHTRPEVGAKARTSLDFSIHGSWHSALLL